MCKLSRESLQGAKADCVNFLEKVYTKFTQGLHGVFGLVEPFSLICKPCKPSPIDSF